MGAPLSDVSALAVLVFVLIAHGASVCNGGISTWRHARGGSVAAAVCQRHSAHLQALHMIQVPILATDRALARRSHTVMTRVCSVYARECRCIAVRIQGLGLGFRFRVFGFSFLRSVVYSSANACVSVGRLV